MRFIDRHRPPLSATPLVVVVVVASLLAPAVVWSEPRHCPDGVRISGKPELTEALREHLVLAPQTGACTDVIVEQGERGLRLTLQRDGRTITREVDDIRMASVWLDTWLAPAASVDESDSTEEASQTVAGARATVDDRPTTAAPGPATWAIAIDGRAGLDDGADAWGGVDLSVVGAVTDHVCLGVALGLAWAGERSADVPWEDFHASLRGGGFFDLGDWRLRGLLGLGFFTGGVGSDGEKVLDSGPFGEVVLEASYALSGSWSVVTGLASRVSVSSELNRFNNETSTVLQVPLFVASMHLGVAFTFGGGE